MPRTFEFLSGLSEPERKRRILVPFQAYIDESGGKGEGKWLSMAALIAPAEQWATFSDDWKGVLADEPSINAFHMREAAALEGKFSHWSIEQRDSKINRLVGLVNDYRLTAVLCNIDMDGYEKFFQAERSRTTEMELVYQRLPRAIGDPYQFGFNALMVAVMREVLEQGATEPFEAIFDEKEIFGTRARQSYPLLRFSVARPDRNVMPTDVMFRNDEEFVPLQLADVIAWLSRRELDGRRHSFKPTIERMNGLIYSQYSEWFRESYFEEFARLRAEGPPMGMTEDEWRQS